MWSGLTEGREGYKKKNLFPTQETLNLRCSVYMSPSRKPNQNNKNKPHQFLLQTLAASAPFGPRLVDLL